ncbi:MAG: hypothetical protein IPM69_20045, partial [Ignavibacteria bacterium]|nr:hypothetical protein [Ignavibacteria bacterium]
TALSTSRMEAVKSYLEKMWNISANRIKTEVRNLPEKPSNPLTPDGMQENRQGNNIIVDAGNTDVVNTSDTLRVANPRRSDLSPQLFQVKVLLRGRLR